jgi:hypothetical protein
VTLAAVAAVFVLVALAASYCSRGARRTSIR